MKKNIQIRMDHLWFHYHDRVVLEDIRMEIEKNAVTAISGPSGQGKSSFLMVLNRLWENIPGARVTGRVEMDFGKGFEDIHRSSLPVHRLRQRVGMVFQTPNPLPMSIYKNIAFPLTLMGEKDRAKIAFRVEAALKKAYLWDEVKDRLAENAETLSGGQQQRLCMARALAAEPTVLLLDEPTSSLDEASVRVIEDLLLELKKSCTIILVSHYMDQIRRIADHCLVLSDRRLRPDTAKGRDI
jgi:phosphate transport system ATP-binding protein